jgi:hypothetical protein
MVSHLLNMTKTHDNDHDDDDNNNNKFLCISEQTELLDDQYLNQQ